MKRVPKSHHTERIGIYGVGAKVHRELGWEFRELTGDFGIDAEIEIITDGEPTGKIIATQIKSGLSYFAVEDATGIVFHGEPQHLKYWLDHKLPVIVVLYDPEKGTAYWQHVSDESITRLPKTWRMSIPRSQTLEAAHVTRLEKIASRDSKELVEQLKQELREYRCPFCGAPLAVRGGDWVGSEHYGLHEILNVAITLWTDALNGLARLIRNSPSSRITRWNFIKAQAKRKLGGFALLSQRLIWQGSYG